MKFSDVDYFLWQPMELLLSKASWYSGVLLNWGTSFRQDKGIEIVLVAMRRIRVFGDLGRLDKAKGIK